MGQLTIITGASSGIGASLAELAASKGHFLATISRRPGPGHHLVADLSDPRSWDTVSNWINGLVQREQWDRVVFIHNAGTLDPMGFAGEVDSAAYARNVLLNSASPQVLGDRFIASAEGAGIVAHLQIISSGAGKREYMGWSSYCAGKAAADMWVRTAGVERAHRGSALTVVSVAPGVVDTDMQAEIRQQRQSEFPGVENFHQLHSEGALAAPDDVARILLALSEVDAGGYFGNQLIENGALLDVRSFTAEGE